ncbi:MAG TPA: hypothetical protein VME46_03195 [Acidimicrobiales bacterium]|nr:hypothetical protein [Acidimicrobiales bacterium]
MTPGTAHFSFIGVTTARSAIMRVFPLWARHLGLDGVEMVGHDLPLRATPATYRDVVGGIKAGAAELGGLVTSHKIDVFDACGDIFDYVDPYAQLCGEVSCLSKRDGQFRAHAKDPISSGRALDEFVPAGYWSARAADVLLFGAGGSNLAISLHLLATRPPEDRPARIVVVNRGNERLERMRVVHERLGVTTPVRYVANADPAVNDGLMAGLPDGSLVVNGTGMGKDTPGSPVTDEGVFPEEALVWELNYRGQLDFLHQAERQQTGRRLVVEDGWRYFVHGWTCAMEEVFGVEMTPDVVGDLAGLASEVRV